MSSSGDLNENLSETTAAHHDLLFNNSLYQNNWNEKTPERSSISSLSPDIACRQKKFSHQSQDDNRLGSDVRNFLPTLQFQPIFSSSERASLSDTAFTEDSLEEADMELFQTEENEERSDIEGDSLDETKMTEKKPDGCKSEGGNPVDYLDTEVFPVLLPCLEKMLFSAMENDVLKVQKSRFNGLDYLAELLWNCNPLHPERQGSYITIFDIPFVQKHLENNPRPTMPQSWLWTREEAAVRIQAAVRGYLVRQQPEVQEMRQFWKDLAREKLQSQEMQTMPEEDNKKSTINRHGESNYSFYSQFVMSAKS